MPKNPPLDLSFPCPLLPHTTASDTTHPLIHEQPGSHELCSNSVAIVLPLRRHANEPDADLPEQAIDESIAGTALRKLMGGVIEFNGGHDSR